LISKITVMGGLNKNGDLETIPMVEIFSGEIVAVVGPTGSGKSQLISDIEYWADKDTPSKRQILINGLLPESYATQTTLRRLVAEISQNMNFVIDMPVREFLILHAQSRGIESAEIIAQEVCDCANQLTGEPIRMEHNLTSLSGGQSRALMVADVALLSNAPIVLIDEIENAGINRLQALQLLAGQKKVVLVVTHDPMLALIAGKRIVMKHGGITKFVTASPADKAMLSQLLQVDKVMCELRERIRQGEDLSHVTIREAFVYQ